MNHHRLQSEGRRRAFAVSAGSWVIAALLGLAAGEASCGTITIPGTSCPWLAGAKPGTPAVGGDAAPAQSPVLFTNFTSGLGLVFAATGSAGYMPGNSSGPEGIAALPVNHAAENGIGGISNAPVNCLLGVFLDETEPSPQAPAPPSLDFGPNGLRNQSPLAPALRQPFLIGSGVTSNGVPRAARVPAGATRLFLGTCDGYGWANNVGGFQVDVSSRTVILSLTRTGGTSDNLTLLWSAAATGQYRVLSSTDLSQWFQQVPAMVYAAGLNTTDVGPLRPSVSVFFRIEYVP